VRRRLALAVALLTLACVGFSAWGLGKLAAPDAFGHGLSGPQLAGAMTVLVILMAFMFSTVLVLGAAFLGATSLGNELDSGVLLSVLPRPLRRIELIGGKWLGVFVVLMGYAFFAIACEALVIRWRTGFIAPHVLEAFGFIAAMVGVVLTFALALSLRLAPLTAAFISVVLYGAGWIDGIVHLLGLSLHNDGVSTGTLAAGLVFPTDGLWRGVLYELQPAAVVATGMSGPSSAGPFAVSGPPTVAFLLWCIAWVGLVGWAGVAAFRHRDV